MRTAIIGTGFSAAMHAQTLKELGHQIICVINPHEEKAKAFAAEWEIPHTAAVLEDALQMELDSVHVCTPPTSHFEIIKTAIAANLHIFCEKPLCLKVDEAAELYQLAEERQLVHAVNFNNRFYEVCEQMKAIAEEDDFGSACLIHGNYLQEYHVLPDFYSWRYKPETAGLMRAVTEIGSHWIDLARFVTGLEIESVSATFCKFSPERVLKENMMYPTEAADTADVHIKSEDTASVTMRFSNGAMGNVLLSEVSHGRINQLCIEVSSPSQSIWWESEDPYQLHQAQKSTGIQTKTFPFGKGFLGTFHDCIASFYDAIENGKISLQPQYATFLDGAVNTAVCDAVYESATHHSAWIGVQSI